MFVKNKKFLLIVGFVVGISITGYSSIKAFTAHSDFRKSKSELLIKQKEVDSLKEELSNLTSSNKQNSSKTVNNVFEYSTINSFIKSLKDTKIRSITSVNIIGDDIIPVNSLLESNDFGEANGVEYVLYAKDVKTVMSNLVDSRFIYQSIVISVSNNTLTVRLYIKK